MLTRRSIAIGLPALLVACAQGGSGPSITPAQIVQDLQGGLSKTGLVVQVLEAQVPPAITPAQAAPLLAQIATAESALALLSPIVTQAQSVTTIEQGEAVLNLTLNTLATVPAIPPQYKLYVVAASVIAPIIEQYIASVTGQPVAAHAAAPSGMTVEQARAILRR